MCDRGKVSRHPVPPTNLEQKVGEWFDVKCVAEGKKPLAALDYSNYGRKKIKHKDLVRKIIAYANSKGVQVLHMKKEGGMYLKTIFFKPSQFENAKRLMFLLWVDQGPGPIFYNYTIGKLLGYSLPNIKYFIERDGYTLTKELIQQYNTILKNTKVTMEQLPGVVRYTSIPDPDVSVLKRKS